MRDLNRDENNIRDVIKKFITNIQWNMLNSVYGNCHNTIIGLISLEWIKKKGNSVFEACPQCNGKSPDILLNKNNEVFAVVEVETSVAKYLEKLNNLKEFYSYYQGVKLAILIALNDNNGENRSSLYKHYWNKNSHHKNWKGSNFYEEISKIKIPILVVSIEKEKCELIKGFFGELRKRHNFNYNVCNVEYRIYNENGEICDSGILWCS